MSSICVRSQLALSSLSLFGTEQRCDAMRNRSIYQDVPLYTLEEFIVLAPPQARTDAVLADNHQLMLNRLSFELAERQRSAPSLSLKRATFQLFVSCVQA